MRLVDDDEIDVQPLPPGERLNAADLNRRFVVGARVRALHDPDAVDALGLEGRNGLINKVYRRHCEGDALSLVEGALDNVGRREGLAEAGRGLQHWTPLSGHERGAQFIEGALLIGAKGAKARALP